MKINLPRQDWELSGILANKILDYVKENVNPEYNSWTGPAGNAWASKNEDWILYSGMDYVLIEITNKKHETYLSLLCGEKNGN